MNNKLINNKQNISVLSIIYLIEENKEKKVEFFSISGWGRIQSRIQIKMIRIHNLHSCFICTISCRNLDGPLPFPNFILVVIL